MGAYAAHCMVGVADELASGFNFELFTHGGCTRHPWASNQLP